MFDLFKFHWRFYTIYLKIKNLYIILIYKVSHIIQYPSMNNKRISIQDYISNHPYDDSQKKTFNFDTISYSRDYGNKIVAVNKNYPNVANVKYAFSPENYKMEFQRSSHSNSRVNWRSSINQTINEDNSKIYQNPTRYTKNNSIHNKSVNVKRQRKNRSRVSRGNMTSKSRSDISHQLKQVIQQIEQQNKTVLNQTQQTISHFQGYMNQLIKINIQQDQQIKQLKSAVQNLQEKLHKQPSQINQDQINKLVTIKNCKSDINYNSNNQNNVSFESNRKIKNLIQLPNDNSKNIVQSKIDKINSKLKLRLQDLKDEIQSKDRMYKLLEESVSSKEQLIMKMSKFNNQLCNQIIQLKQKMDEDFLKSEGSNLEKQKQRRNSYAQKDQVNNEHNWEYKMTSRALKILQNSVKEFLSQNTKIFKQIELNLQDLTEKNRAEKQMNHRQKGYKKRNPPIATTIEEKDFVQMLQNISNTLHKFCKKSSSIPEKLLQSHQISDSVENVSDALNQLQQIIGMKPKKELNRQLTQSMRKKNQEILEGMHKFTRSLERFKNQKTCSKLEASLSNAIKHRKYSEKLFSKSKERQKQSKFQIGNDGRFFDSNIS